MTTTIEILRRHGACDPAIKWVGERTPREAWEQCDNPRWLLWAAEKAGVAKPPIVRIACRVARSVLHRATPGDDRPRLAIEAAEAWIADPSEANRLEAYARAADAYSYARAADAYSYAYAYAAAAAAAYAAAAAANAAASAAASDAYAAAYAGAAYASYAYAARGAAAAAYAEAICAIIRDEIPWADVAAGLGVES